MAQEMSKTLEQVRALVANGEVQVSLHGYEELAEDGLHLRDVINVMKNAALVEDYPDYAKWPCVLVLEYDRTNQPVHVVWGIPAGRKSPAVVVTAYRPDPGKWDETWRRRKT